MPPLQHSPDAPTTSSDHPFGTCLHFTAAAVARELTRMAEEVFQPTGLCPSAAMLLVEAAREPGIAPTVAAQRLHLAASSVTRFADTLVGRGLLVRQARGRGVSLGITDAGRRFLPEIAECQRVLTERLTAAVGGDRARRLASELAEAVKSFP